MFFKVRSPSGWRVTFSRVCTASRTARETTIPAGGAWRLKSRSDVYVVAEDVIVLDDDIPQVKADPERDHLILGFVAIGVDSNT